MKYNFDEIRDRRNTGKWGLATQYGAIGIGVADMDFKLAPEIIEAVKECAELGEFGYAGMQGRVSIENRMIYRDGDYFIDFENLEDCFRQGAKVLMM